MLKLPLLKKDSQEPKAEEKRNSFVDQLSIEYLKLCVEDLGLETVGSRIKGRFPDIKYTLDGYDVTDLPHSERRELIRVLYTLVKEFFGDETAKARLEKTVLRLKDRFGVEKEFEEALSILPEGILDLHKVRFLDRDELEDKYKRTILKLEKSKEVMEKSVEERTVELAIERDLLETVLYNTTDGVFTIDRAGNIVTFNRIMEELTGYVFEDVENRPADEFVRLFENFAPLETRVYCPKTGDPSERNVYTNNKLTLVGRSGRKSYVKIVSTTIPEEQEVKIDCIVTITDITREIELDIMKLDFVSMAAHELRTPITSIRGYLEVLADELKDGLSDIHKQYFDRLQVSGDRLYILVENLLNISKIENGTLVLDKKSEVWISIVKEEIMKFEESAVNSGITLRLVEGSETLSDVLIDKKIVGEVLSNLLDNAINHTPEGGWIEVILEERDGFVVTHVKDNGLGIPPASIPHVFKKFYTATNVLKKDGGGTGLGLFIAKEIVRLHGGKIWVDSVEGKGSEFSFSVPVYKKEQKI